MASIRRELVALNSEIDNQVRVAHDAQRRESVHRILVAAERSKGDAMDRGVTIWPV